MRTLIGIAQFNFTTKMDDSLNTENNCESIRSAITDALKAIPGLEIASNTLNVIIQIPNSQMISLTPGRSRNPSEPEPGDGSKDSASSE